MPGPPPSSPGDLSDRLQRCIRDLAALNALPSMCIGRSPDETFDIVLDALPTALGCELIYLKLPGTPPKECATLRGSPLSEGQLAELTAAIAGQVDGAVPLVTSFAGMLWCLEAALPVHGEQGRLLAGRSRRMDPETDRVLVRSAANLVGTTLESANVLENARRTDEFLAMLGHELRNPLAPILTAVELLARNTSADRERHIIERHTRHLAHLVDDLLDISRITRGHIELRREQVSLASVLERAVELAAPLVSRFGHTLKVARTEPVMLLGDPVRLAQIFGNLLTNAATFTPPGGSIDVSIDRTQNRVRVRVRDTGRGIAGHQLESIFEPFVQADRVPLSGGLGLGLAIVNDLVKRHGGTITVYSEGRGRGATFTVELPTVARTEEPIEKAAQPKPQVARAGVRVLVVDDNVDLAELLSTALEMHGFETAVEHSARAAIERWQTFSPHAAVLDVGLPDLDGYELAKRLRSEHGTFPTLIAATGYGQQKDRLRATDAGFDCHFVKPVSLQDLVSVLDQRVVGSDAPRNTPTG